MEVHRKQSPQIKPISFHYSDDAVKTKKHTWPRNRASIFPILQARKLRHKPQVVGPGLEPRGVDPSIRAHHSDAYMCTYDQIRFPTSQMRQPRHSEVLPPCPGSEQTNASQCLPIETTGIVSAPSMTLSGELSMQNHGPRSIFPNQSRKRKEWSKLSHGKPCVAPVNRPT